MHSSAENWAAARSQLLSPLKKALMDSELCEDITVSPYDSVKESSLTIDFHNVKDGSQDELYELFVSAVKKISRDGIDKTMLEASLNNFEFKTRERDFGTMPKGVIYAMTVLETELYGGAPEQNLSFEKSFASLREKLNTDYFEKLLCELFVENEHRATLIMHPSETLGKRRADAEARELSEIKNSMSEAELAKIKKEAEELKLWQKIPTKKRILPKYPF